MARILDTRAMAAQGREKLAQQAARFQRETNLAPSLTMVSIGQDDSIAHYIRVVRDASLQVGVRVEARALPESSSEAQVEEALREMNEDASIHGISLQLPLPPQLNIECLSTLVHPDKDVEGYHPQNVSGLSQGTPRLVPPPAQGALAILDAFGIDVAGMMAVVVGRTPIIGRPVATLLQQAGAAVAVAHRQTPNLAGLARHADLLVLGASMPGVLRAECLKPGVIVLDYGINYVADAQTPQGRPRIVGNLNLDEAQKVVGAITPMPGGTGPMTTLSLLRNTLKAAQLQVLAPA